MSLNVGNLAGDMYLNFFILSLVEIPGALLIWFFMSRYCIVLMIYDTSVFSNGIKFCHSVKFFVFAHFSPRYGRRIPYASFMIFVGLTGMLVLAVPPDEGW